MPKYEFDSKILSSSHLNFLFGAGVNGGAFPQISGFKKSLKVLKTLLGEEINSFEKAIDSLPNKKDKEQVIDEFKKEFGEFSEKIDYSHISIKNIEKLFSNIQKLVEESENRTKTTKQINIFTLNYDFIVENVLDNLGLLNNSISSSNINNHDRFFYMVGYNFLFNKFVPTYLVSKLHGDISNPVLPGNDKYDLVMQANRFEIIFKMKEKLSRENSILFVIGYSGYDEHINKILKDCVSTGLTIYWFKYKKEDEIPESLIDKVFIIENDNGEDTSLVCANMVSKLWEKSLDE